MTERALSGMRVLDLTQFESGPSCTQFLAWLGAEVIKVEPPTGDPMRRPRPWERREVDSMFYLLHNANKRSIVIDLKRPDGHALFLRLVALSDVVVENFALGAMEKLRLDYEALRGVNPAIIVARIKGFGLSGPYSEYKSFEMIAQAAAGVMSVNGFSDREPVRVGVGIGDTGTGVHTAGAIMAAYIQRLRTGQGQLVEVSMQEVLTNFLRQRYPDHYGSEGHAPRMGNELTGSVPAGVFPCKPGGANDYVYILIHAATEKMWGGFARAIDRPDLLDDPRFRDAAARWRHRADVNTITHAWTSQRSKREAMETLGRAGVPCSAVLDTADVLDDPHLSQRGAIVAIDHPTWGRYRMPGCPVRLSASPSATAPPPLLGQHTAEVLRELLGLSASEVDDLRARGVVA
ncbi:MAG: CoA transferase [Chloroflexi bacterium]|nr:CoA transferase [Chloroflexota bacterium]